MPLITKEITLSQYNRTSNPMGDLKLVAIIQEGILIIEGMFAINLHCSPQSWGGLETSLDNTESWLIGWAR